MKTKLLIILCLFISYSAIGQSEYKVKKNKVIDDVYYTSPENVDTKYKIKKLEGNSSYYLKKSSENLMIGLGMCLAGTATCVGSSFIKDTDTMKTLTYVGVGIGVVGLIELFIGSQQIGKAGICLDQERKIFMSPAKSGVGVNIKF